MSSDKNNIQLSGSISRNQLPHTISSLYHKYTSAETNAQKVDLLFALVEGVLRFFAIILVSNAIAIKPPPPKKIEQWYQILGNPAMGKLIGLCRSCRKHIVESGDPGFVPELIQFINSDNWEKPNDIRNIRNRRVHLTHALSEEQGSLYLKELKPLLKVLMDNIRWLQNYRFGVFTYKGHIRRKKIYEYAWRMSRGRVEEREPIRIYSKNFLPANEIILLNKDLDTALILSPLFLRTDYQGFTQYMWFSGIENNGNTTHLKYTHPILTNLTRTEILELDNDEFSFEEYKNQPDNWQQLETLEITEESKEKIYRGTFSDTFREKYDVIRVIGRGGMGTIYEAKDTFLKRKVALKVLNIDQNTSPIEIERFKLEGSSLVNCKKHPLIVEVYTTGETDEGSPCLVMELIEGRSLREVLDEDGYFTWKEAVQIIYNVLDALVFIHNLQPQLIHRDIKPSNIMQSEDNIKLIDFGIAKEIGGATLTRTSTLSALGTELYMAEEQWKNKATAKSDLYSCGVLLGTLIGKPPEIPNRPPSIDDMLDIPKWLKTFHAKSIQSDPKDRFSSAKEMLNELSRLHSFKVNSMVQETFSPGDTIEKHIDDFTFRMLYCPKGTIEITFEEERANKYKIERNENSTKKVISVPAFEIGEYQVTQKLWSMIMTTDPSKFKGTDRPVEQVSWFDCIRFCNKLSLIHKLDEAYIIRKDKVILKKNTNGYRLPEEYEWEYAAKANSPYLYSGSNQVDAVAWYSKNSGRNTKSVGIKKPNKWNIYDMSGNVYEWCNLPCEYLWTNDNNILSHNIPRSIRGGGCFNGPERCKISFRGETNPKHKRDRLGFRIVRTIL